MMKNDRRESRGNEGKDRGNKGGECREIRGVEVG